MATDEKVEKVRCADCIYLDDHTFFDTFLEKDVTYHKCGIYDKVPNLKMLRICYDHQS